MQHSAPLWAVVNNINIHPKEGGQCGKGYVSESSMVTLYKKRIKVFYFGVILFYLKMISKS